MVLILCGEVPYKEPEGAFACHQTVFPILKVNFIPVHSKNSILSANKTEEALNQINQLEYI